MKNFICCLMALFAVCAMTSCEKESAPTKIPESPVELPYAEYSLSGTSCEWNFTKEDSDIIVVNSREELEKYIVDNDVFDNLFML